MNDLGLAGTLVTTPSISFAELRERPRSWFPLLLLVTFQMAIVYWYYSVVDIEWWKDLVLANDPSIKALDEEQRAASLAMFGRSTLLWTSLISICIFVPVMLLLQALYFLLAAKVSKLPQVFSHWFALTCWCSLPLLIGVVVSAILLTLADSPQVSPAVIQPLSLNELVFHRPLGSPGHTLLETLSIPSFLSWALMIIGVRAWSQRSWPFSATFVMLPIVAIYGIWSVFAFR